MSNDNEFNTIVVTAPQGVQALATQVVWAGQGTVLLFNSDSQNTVYLTDNNSYLSVDQGNISPLGPKSSLAFDGSRDVYALAAPGMNVVLYAYPSAFQFTQAASLTSLFQGGTLSGSPATTIPSSATPFTALNKVDVSNFSSYDLNMYLVDTTGATTAVQVNLLWYDDLNSGIPIAQESWWVWVASAILPVGSNPMAGFGPMHGRYFTLQINNFSGRSTVTLQFLNVFGSPRSVSTSDWRSNPQAIATGNGGGSDVSGNSNITIGNGFDNCLGGMTHVNLPIGGTPMYFNLGLYTGTVSVYLHVDNANGLAQDIVFCTAHNNKVFAGGGTGETNVIYDVAKPSGSGVALQGFLTYFPKAAVAMIVTGNATAATQFSFAVNALQR